jgi:hypothetical protein
LSAKRSVHPTDFVAHNWRWWVCLSKQFFISGIAALDAHQNQTPVSRAPGGNIAFFHRVFGGASDKSGKPSGKS